MRGRALLPGAIFLLLGLAPLPAAAQAWSLQVDVPADLRFRSEAREGPSKLTAQKTDGLLVAVGTPYHVGFGVENFTAEFEPEPKQIFELKVETYDVFVDLPVPLSQWIAFSVGTGWGQGSFDPDVIPESTGSSTLEKINLWQFFATLGIKIAWGFDVRLGYHEYRGRFVVRHPNPQDPFTTQDVTLTLTTLGLRYTF